MSNFFVAPVNALRPLFVTNYLGGDVLKLGWLGAAFGAGVIAGGLILNAWSGFKRRILTSLICSMIWGISITVFGFTTESLFFIGLGMLLIAGISLTMGNAAIWAIIQAKVAKDMQGRVSTLVLSVTGGMMPLGLVIAGPLADAIELRTIWYISGISILALAIAGFFSRDLMNIENKKVEEKPANFRD
jgi:DHA3 family macrolide efflux protein-like MFS transporter